MNVGGLKALVGETYDYISLIVLRDLHFPLVYDSGVIFCIHT